MGRLEEELQLLKEQLAKRDAQLDQLLAKFSAQAPESQDEQLKRQISDLDGSKKPLPKERMIPCVSALTGATFMCRVIESRTSPEGRVVELVDYKEPPGAFKYTGEGGLIPERHPSFDKKGERTLIYKQWLYSTFWQADLNAYCNRTFQKQFAVDPTVNVPWTQPANRVRNEME